MKLVNWIIADALKRNDWQTAINATCDLFGLDRFTPNSDMIKSACIRDTKWTIDKIPPQIKICYAGRNYEWVQSLRRIGPGYDNKIYIWAQLAEVVREASCIQD